MSIAWGSLVLLVVLLPGVLFFVGVYFPEQFTREVESQSALGQLAGVLLIALVVHGVWYAALSPLCGGIMPCIRVDLLLETINIEPKTVGASARLNRMVIDHHLAILSYLLLTATSGTALGWGYGRLVIRGTLRQLSRHPWAHDLNVNGLTVAYVMTHMKHDDRYLIYKGFLRAFGLQKDGRFSYIILSDVTRSYLRMLEAGSATSGMDEARTMGQSIPDDQVVLPNAPSKRQKRHKSMFVIEGEDTANVVFDLLKAPSEALSETNLQDLITEVRRELDLVAVDIQRQRAKQGRDTPGEIGPVA